MYIIGHGNMYSVPSTHKNDGYIVNESKAEQNILLWWYSDSTVW